MKYDVIVVGGGFAGLSAALFAGIWRLKTIVLEAETLPTLWSYPRRGFLGTISGAELIQRMVDEAKQRGVEIHTGERVIDLKIGEKNCENSEKKLRL